MHNQTSPLFTLFVGIDWADNHHDICIIDQNGHVRQEQIEHSAEAIEQWVSRTLEQAGSQAGFQCL